MTVKQLYKIAKQLREDKAPHDIVSIKVLIDNEEVYLTLEELLIENGEIFLEASDDNR